MLSATNAFKVGRQELLIKTPAPAPEKQKTPTYNMTMQQIEELKRQAAADAVADLMTLTLGLPAMVLHDKHGWREAELNDFIDAVSELFDSYEKGYIRLEDCINTLKEEAGIKKIILEKRGREVIL